jgi:hypothetical protein
VKEVVIREEGEEVEDYQLKAQRVEVFRVLG